MQLSGGVLGFARAALAVAILMVPVAASAMPTMPDRITVAEPGYSGGPDGQGGGSGCSSGPGWQGCGGWNPFTGGFGSGCYSGICGGWDGSRFWGG